MLDLKFIRQYPEIVEDAIRNKNESFDLKYLLKLDEDKRQIQFKYDSLKAEQNRFSQQIPKLKKQDKDVSDLISRMKIVSSEIKDISTHLSLLSEKLNIELLRIPNIPDPDIPIGKDESDNELVREWGEKKKFNFEPHDHIYLIEKNKFIDLDRSTKISGSGFVIYTGQGAILERALINFMLDFHLKKHGYTEIKAPFLVNRKTMTGTGQLPKLENDMYHIEKDDFFLIPTSEVSVTNIFADEILPYNMLPQKFVSYSPCFRREAGSYGKDTKGLQRVHQFNKVEMVRFTHPEKSKETLESMTNDAEEILQALGLHYRVVKLATGDLSFASAKTYDLEVWAPGSKKYLEVSSISNFIDFQARRASIRYRNKEGKVNFLHTLNGSGLATPRTFIALIETYQTKDGMIELPEILYKYIV